MRLAAIKIKPNEKLYSLYLFGLGLLVYFHVPTRRWELWGYWGGHAKNMKQILR